MICQDEHPELYRKWNEFDASLLKKNMRIYDNTILLCSDDRVKHIEQLMAEDLDEFDQIFS